MKKITISLLLLFTVLSSIAQNSILGKVTNHEGYPLTGANVQVKETYLGSTTNVNGEFVIKQIPKGTHQLLISYIGYNLKEIQIDIPQDTEVIVQLEKADFVTDEILIEATRLSENAPFSYTSLSKDEIQERNYGQDIPYLLQQSPSLVATSDAGTGIGYTNFRIRGTDMNRINVTLNGIPMNDGESHGVWWVDLPDFAESVDNIQIQRGVGSSVNGAAAFGATINLQTTTLNKEPYAKLTSIAGSYNTFKNSVGIGTGLIQNHFTFDARLSSVKSDGFIDRSWVDLKSYFLSGGFYSDKSIVKINVFSGFEETYQAWWGVPSVKLKGDNDGMKEYLDNWLYSDKEYQHMLNSDNRTYNYYTYDNQIDHYRQDHYQFLFSHEVYSGLNFNITGHYTHGEGYYEQYNDKNYLYDDVNLVDDYGLDSVKLGDTVIVDSDLIRRKWLDNNFYGIISSVNYKSNKTEFNFGVSLNQYKGNHFGRIIWSEFANEATRNYEWYRNSGIKSDFSAFTKLNYYLTSEWGLYGDIQLRKIFYQIDGFDDDLTEISQEHDYIFLNPKIGARYTIDSRQSAYISYGMANREPNRSNFIDADASNPLPNAETLNDFEAGYKFSNKSVAMAANLYYMKYKDQLVLTGKINDVGSAIMTNVKDSYRAGIELISAIKVTDYLNWDANITLSKNKILNYIEFVDNWDTWSQEKIQKGKTNISFSPEVIANSNIRLHFSEQLNISFVSNYVGDQYIDNSSSPDRMLDSYFVNNLKLEYRIAGLQFKNIQLQFQVNNLFNVEYESNAWVYRYILGGEEYKQDGYFPQAGIHFLGGITLTF